MVSVRDASAVSYTHLDVYKRQAYVLGRIAVKGGHIYEVNQEDFFDIGKLSLKSLNQSVPLAINNEPTEYTTEWLQHVWTCLLYTSRCV